jgi:hypothetical protein
MTRRHWLWTALMAVPLAVAGGFAFANTASQAGYTCPLTGETLPCPDCCPLNDAEPASQACCSSNPQ